MLPFLDPSFMLVFSAISISLSFRVRRRCSTWFEPDRHWLDRALRNPRNAEHVAVLEEPDADDATAGFYRPLHGQRIPHAFNPDIGTKASQPARRRAGAQQQGSGVGDAIADALAWTLIS